MKNCKIIWFETTKEVTGSKSFAGYFKIIPDFYNSPFFLPSL